MIKRIFLLITAAILCLSFCTTAFAETFTKQLFIDSVPYIEDYSDAERIEMFLQEICNRYGVDVAIYTEDEMCASSPEEASEVAIEYFELGSQNGGNVILLYVAKDVRKYNFHIAGEKANRVVNDNGLTYLEQEIVPYLSSDDYYEAFKTFAKSTEYLLELDVQGTPYDKKSSGYVIVVIAVAILLPLVVAFIAMWWQLQKMNTAKKENYASNYVKAGSMVLSNSRDIFLYSRVIRKAKPKNTSSSSGGNTNNRSGSF